MGKSKCNLDLMQVDVLHGQHLSHGPVGGAVRSSSGGKLKLVRKLLQVFIQLQPSCV